jgi:uracil-DNA glycosylase family 4
VVINLPEKTETPTFVAHANCAECPLQCNPVHGVGNPDAKLVIVGEAPKWRDVQRNVPMSGEAAELIKRTLDVAGEDGENVWTTNAVLCRSFAPDGEELPPPASAIAACRPRLLAELRAINPEIVLTIGGGAAKAAFGSRTSLNEIQGVVEHVRDFPAPVLPTYHPGHILNDNIGQFDTFLSSVRRAVRIAQGRMTLPNRNEAVPWKHVTTPADIMVVLTDIQNGKAGFTLAIDVETSGLSIVDSALLQVSIGNTERGVAIEYSGMDAACVALMADLLRDERFLWIIHNMSFDRQRFQKFFGAVPARDVDTMCLALGLTERSEGVGLKRLSREWLNTPYYESEVHAYLGGAKNDWAAVPRPVLARYAVLDTVYTARMFPILDELVTEEGTRELAYNLLMPAQRAFADFEMYGVQVDRTYITTLAAEWEPKVDAARAAIQDYVRAQGWRREVPGKSYRVQETVMVEEPLYVWHDAKGNTRHSKRRSKSVPADAKVLTVSVPKQKSVWKKEMVEQPLNVNSSTQLADFLFDYLKLPLPPEGRKTGKEFRDHYPEHQFSRLHGEYALMNRMLNTYVKGIGEEIASDGRVHPNFLLFGAVTGRLAIHNPALQTIPREDILESGGVRRFDSIKRLFVPSSGFTWFETDYAQLELRVGWHVSEDEQFGEAIMSGDFHRLMASKVFGLPPEQITDLQRHDTKRIVFGIMYGRMAPAIAKQLGCSIETAQHYIDQFFGAAPKYYEWYRRQQQQALETGRSTTSFGRVRRWNIVTRENRQNVLNQAVNFPIQSTASDLCLTAAIKLNEWFKETGYGHVLFLVHDSINYEAREGKEEIVANRVREIMTTWPFPSPAVLDVETKFGTSWGETKKWKYA